VLRRLCAGGEAVALHEDLGKLNHQFGYAADGDVIAMLNTSVPPCWSGRDPGRFVAATSMRCGPILREQARDTRQKGASIKVRRELTH